jgi:hypothetical protein
MACVCVSHGHHEPTVSNLQIWRCEYLNETAASSFGALPALTLVVVATPIPFSDSEGNGCGVVYYSCTFKEMCYVKKVRHISGEQ